MLLRLDKDGQPIEVYFLSIIDLTAAPRDPETGEIIMIESESSKEGFASQLRAAGVEVTDEEIDLFG